MSRTTKYVLFSVLATVCLIGLVVAQNLKAKSAKLELIEKVKGSSESAVNFTNFPTVPMTIVSAGSKVVDGTTFRSITDESIEGSSFASLPVVVLMNNSERTIRKFIVLVGNKKTIKSYTLSFGRVSIVPKETYIVKHSEWRGKKQDEDFDSPRLWWISETQPSDLTVRVARVEYDDGSVWLIDDNTGGNSWQ